MEIFGEGEPAEYLYEVVRGLVRRYKMLSDGRRQIVAFHRGTCSGSKEMSVTASRPKR
jgi:CRP-like cAMP-binding protein